MRFLVLYEELASYFLTCLNHMAKNSNCEIVVYMKKINSIAPFKFETVHPNIQIHERENLTFEELNQAIANFKPDFTYLSGWIYKPYLKIIKQLGLKKVIIGFDNHYTGSFKQKLGIIYFKRFLKPYIKAAFVPGDIQVVYAKKLGFSTDHISKNVYCCDFELYNTYYKQTHSAKINKFPKRLIFVGRYVEEKGINLLWDSFIELQHESPNEWELWCIGKGPIAPKTHPQIKHLGFVQPTDFLPIIQETGVFVLPSYFEPWGVVVHEFAIAGFPIITTSSVGAASTFLHPKQNGILIKANNKTELKNALKKIVSSSDAELNEMGVKSHQLAQQITPQIWQDSILRLVNG
jgi:glycosyltransferase involved in cell wall biosynthesis